MPRPLPLPRRSGFVVLVYIPMFKVEVESNRRCACISLLISFFRLPVHSTCSLLDWFDLGKTMTRIRCRCAAYTAHTEHRFHIRMKKQLNVHRLFAKMISKHIGKR